MEKREEETGTPMGSPDATGRWRMAGGEEDSYLQLSQSQSSHSVEYLHESLDVKLKRSLQIIGIHVNVIRGKFWDNPQNKIIYWQT